MNKYVKALIVVIFVAVIGFVIYKYMPESGHNFIQYKIQMATSKEKKAAIESVQNAKVKGYDELTYKNILENYCKDSCWIYEVDPAGDGYTITYTGDEAAFNLAYEGDDANVTTDSTVRIVFRVKAKGNFSYDMMVDGKKLDKNQRKPYIEAMAQKYRSDH